MECLNCRFFHECEGDCLLFEDPEFKHYDNYKLILTTFARKKSYIQTLKKVDTVKGFKLNLEIKK